MSVIAGTIVLGSCTTARTILKQAPTTLPSNWQPPPRQSMPAPMARALLQDHVYGRMDLAPEVDILDFTILSDEALDGQAILAQWGLQIGYGSEARELDLITLIPKGKPDAPIILSQNFCPNDAVIPLGEVRPQVNVSFDCSGGGLAWAIFGQIFGRYIVTPPLQDILSRGYGFAAVYPSQFIPDSGQSGLAVLEVLFPNEPDRPGALAVWASLFEVAAQTIEAEFGDRAMIAYGHSRFAKTALLAGAWSNRIDAVIAHQSGTLGASALDDGTGEPLGDMVKGYPHWVGPGIAPYMDRPAALPVRPADLLALIGDKPVLLGNARRDVWSDPWGAFTEAKSAWGNAFGASNPSDFRPADQKAYWLRAGTHGVVKEDWPAFLDFLDANMAGD